MIKLMRVAVMALFLSQMPPAPGLAQEGTAPTPALERDVLYLNTIGSFSAGFVLQAYGYIGALADIFSQNVYGVDQVRTELGETVVYLKNVNSQLIKFQAGHVFVAAEDRIFIANIMRIIEHLIREAEALSAFTVSKSKDDLNAYADARREAWADINKVLHKN